MQYVNNNMNGDRRNGDGERPGPSNRERQQNDPRPIRPRPIRQRRDAISVDDDHYVSAGNGLSAMIVHNLIWSYWYAQSENLLPWDQDQDLIRVGTYRKYDQFISAQIPEPSSIPVGQAHCIFKVTIEPDVDHQDNVTGGYWILPINLPRPQVDELWGKLIRELFIVNRFSNVIDEICGAIIHAGNPTNIYVWTRETTNVDICKQLGDLLRTIMGLRCSIYYFKHTDQNNPLFSV